MSTKETAEHFFDELIHDHLLHEDVDTFHDRSLIDDAPVSSSLYTQNTTAWD